jgi:hypothetical protein
MEAAPPAQVNPWLALEAGADPAERSRTLRRAHEAFVHHGADGGAGGGVRRVVGASWWRSLEARVDPDGSAAPIDLADRDLEAYRAAHPLAAVLPLLRDVLGDTGDQLMAVTDAAGRLLWVEGQAVLRHRAEVMNFVPGAWWDERHVGTNAPGTALAVDHAVQIFAAEHFTRAVQPWTCSAAPIHDPLTGRPLGAVDITGGDQLANPHSLALVRAAARLAETFLASSASPPRQNGLNALGTDDASLVGPGGRLVLSRRHGEILVLLLVHPEGLTGDQLGLELYGDELNPVTLRAELSRLRRLVGPELLDSRPYRLRMPVDADFLTVMRLLDRGALREALTVYRGPLLPGSDAPGVVRLRTLLDQQARAGLLADGDAVLLDAWTRSPMGADDLVVWEALADAVPTGSTKSAIVHARIAGLRAEYGISAGGRRHTYATSLQRRRP